MTDIDSIVLQTIAQTAAVELDSLQPNSTIKQLGIPSLDAIEMLFELEEKFDLELDDSVVDLGTATVSDLVTAIKQALSCKPDSKGPMPAAGAA